MPTQKKKNPSFLCVVALTCLLPLCAHAGSISQINQSMEKPKNWAQIVQNSPFLLGETTTETQGDISFQITAYGTYPSLDGSTVSVPMAREFARQHLALTEAELDAFVLFSTTHDAYVNLIEKKPNAGATLPFQGSILQEDRPVDIFIGTEPSEDELALAAEKGVRLTLTPVCYDAFVFIVNAVNPIESLTVEQIRRIYGNNALYGGKPLYWEDLGVEGLFDDDQQTIIRSYTRPRNSGSQTAMENLVMQGTPIAETGFYEVFGMGDLIDHMEDYANSRHGIGYTYLFYINALYKSAGIKTIAIDGVAPTEENIRSGAYPFATCYYAVTREGESTDFIQWMTGPEGQKCIKQAGYIPYLEGV